MNKMNYRQAGDYLIPNMELENQSDRVLGKYGRMRRAYLEQNNPMLLNDMILTETLFPHLWEIEDTAKVRVELLMKQYLEMNPAPDKEKDQLGWVRHMNSLKLQAEEVRSDGTYQQLSLNLFLSENDKSVLLIEQRASCPLLFLFHRKKSTIFLLLGSNTDEARKIVALDYMKQKNVEEIISTLKQVYHGGFGLKEESGNISAWYAEDGIHLAKGSSAIDSPRAQIISWKTVEKRIGELLEGGQFATNVELAETVSYERKDIAQSVWYLFHDLSEEAKKRGFFPSLSCTDCP